MGDVKLRPAVRAFAEAMERQLRRHDRSRGVEGWKGANPRWLLERMESETYELHKALGFGCKSCGRGWRHRDDLNPDRIIREAADVANFAMMIADVSGAALSGEPGNG